MRSSVRRRPRSRRPSAPCRRAGRPARCLSGCPPPPVRAWRRFWSCRVCTESQGAAQAEVEAQRQAALVSRRQACAACGHLRDGAAAGAHLPSAADAAHASPGGWVASFDGGGAHAAGGTPGTSGGAAAQASPPPAGLPASLDPFLMADAAAEPLQAAEHTAPLPAMGHAAEMGGGARHRRTTSEPTSVDRWGPVFGA